MYIIEVTQCGCMEKSVVFYRMFKSIQIREHKI